MLCSDPHMWVGPPPILGFSGATFPSEASLVLPPGSPYSLSKDSGAARARSSAHGCPESAPALMPTSWNVYLTACPPIHPSLLSFKFTMAHPQWPGLLSWISHLPCTYHCQACLWLFFTDIPTYHSRLNPNITSAGDNLPHSRWGQVLPCLYPQDPVSQCLISSKCLIRLPWCCSKVMSYLI